MNHYLLIDGYNIINTWSELKQAGLDSLEEARNMLIQQLVDYKFYTGEYVVVVFDAHMVKGSTAKEYSIKGIEIIFTKEYQTADSYIEKKVDKLTKNRRNKVRVATSDWAEQQVVLGSGATRVSARELKIELETVKRRIYKKTEEINDTRSDLSDRINVETAQILEKWRRNK